MKVSESWLHEHVEFSLTTAELVEQLTMAGLEVDGVEPAAAIFSGVFVGEILSTKAHPNADKLKVCEVRGAAGENFMVVCGAPNARSGMKAPFATLGAKLPGGLNIEKAELRGEESFGMLCSAAELGLSDDDSGLFELPAAAETGIDLRHYLGLDDSILDIDLTPNRGDCLSTLGLSREIAVLNNTKLKWAKREAHKADIEDTLEVHLKADDACPRYAGRIVLGIDSSAETPIWMREKLRRSGIRSIHPVVDVTNFVMLEFGQPMHAFDLANLNGAIEVRYAETGENITLLDGTELKLDTETVLIADQHQALAIAGIMGAQNSGVSTGTVDIFLESAHFKPLAIAGKARQYGLHTDSSHRFERGVDPQLPMAAIERATTLLLEITGGKVGPSICTELKEHLPGPAKIPFRATQIHQQLKLEMAEDKVRSIFEQLGLEAINGGEQAGEWVFKTPSWRFDLAIEADLIEEIARIYGYNLLPSSQLRLAPNIKPSKPRPEALLKDALVSRGYQEAITYSFVAPQIQQLINPGLDAVVIQNPISADMAVMRTSLWPGLLTALQHNLNRQQTRIRLFETGLRFGGGGAHDQWPTVAGLLSGGRYSDNWSNTAQELDFYDAKGDVEAALSTLGIPELVEGVIGEHPALHPGQTLKLTLSNGKTIGYIGKLNPLIDRFFDLTQSVFLFELFLESLPGANVRQFNQISRFPEVYRDIAVVVDRAVPVSELTAAVRTSSSKYLVELKVFDVYEGKGIENNRKSIGLTLTFQDKSRTLSDTEISASEETIVKVLEDQFGASLRR